MSRVRFQHLTDDLDVVLNGTAYHYCAVSDGVWSTFVAASSFGSFFNSQIKGRFDCRTNAVPDY